MSRQIALDNVYYHLNDEVEIKLCVLFCIRYADIPISDIELKHFMLSATSVDFMDLCNAIEKTVSDNYIRKVWRDEIEKFDLTDRGRELIDMFDDKIMASVRGSLKEAIDEYYRREAEKEQAHCEIVPLGKDAYNVNIELKEGKNTLIDMKIFAGSREKAIELRRGFNNNPIGLYSSIISLLSENSEKGDE